MLQALAHPLPGVLPSHHETIRFLPHGVCSAAAPAGLPPVSRPTFLDYFLILLGCALSLYLVELSGSLAKVPQNTPDFVPVIARNLLPTLLFLPLGMLLFWPVFYTTQWLAGRPQALTAGEWLWGFAWLGAVGLVTWIGWQSFADAPEMIKSQATKEQVFVGYGVTVLALAAIALIISFLGLFSRQRPPWTHPFGLVLLIWPSLPMAGLMAWKWPKRGMAVFVGLDIGGANLKAVHQAGSVRLQPFELWRQPERLADACRRCLRTLPACDRLAVTMTGELCDCFASRRAGVLAILAAVASAAAGRAVRIWTNAGRFVDLDTAANLPLQVAAANWLAWRPSPFDGSALPTLWLSTLVRRQPMWCPCPAASPSPAVAPIPNA